MRRLALWIAYHAALTAYVRGGRQLVDGLALRRARRALAAALGIERPHVDPPVQVRRALAGVVDRWSPLVGTGLYPAPEGRA